jgi:hypothetical protein
MRMKVGGFTLPLCSLRLAFLAALCALLGDRGAG